MAQKLNTLFLEYVADAEWKPNILMHCIHCIHYIWFPCDLLRITLKMLIWHEQWRGLITWSEIKIDTGLLIFQVSCTLVTAPKASHWYFATYAGYADSTIWHHVTYPAFCISGVYIFPRSVKGRNNIGVRLKFGKNILLVICIKCKAINAFVSPRSIKFVTETYTFLLDFTFYLASV